MVFFLPFWLYLTPVSIILFVCRAFRFCRLRFYDTNPILVVVALSPSGGIWSGRWDERLFGVPIS